MSLLHPLTIFILIPYFERVTPLVLKGQVFQKNSSVAQSVYL
uniref:Uncharacterized protein n=1 Tax=Anguilla anguilla TaxID=7936 RepID=A0A0E9PKD2_ANGAN